MVAAGDPVNSADLTTDEDYTIRKPLVRLVQAVAQSIPDNTNTELTFTTEDFDTNGFHDNVTNTPRITPTVAGYYRLHLMFAHAARADITTVLVQIGKNGTGQAPSLRWPYPSSVSPGSVPSYQTETILTANGSTDYFTGIVLLDNTANTATLTSVGGATTSTFECEFLRPL